MMPVLALAGRRFLRPMVRRRFAASVRCRNIAPLSPCPQEPALSRSTKIVVTLGPACSEPAVLERMLAAGVDVVRLNFSHGTAADHVERARLVRVTAARLGLEVAIMADLQGPKIRVGKFAQGKVALTPGQTFFLDADCELGNEEGVGLDYKELPRDVEPGAVLLLDDGLIRLKVERVEGRASSPAWCWAARCRTTRASTAWAAGSPRRR